MSNIEKKSSLPELRFPEFETAPFWQQKKLIDTADKEVKWSFIGGPFGSNLKASDYVNSGVRVIQLQNIGDGVFNDEYKIYTSEKKADELLSNNIYPGDIILSKMGDPVGRACLIPNNEHRYVMCSDGIRLVVDAKQYCKYFVYTSINSKAFRSIVEKTATGSTRKRIGLDDLKNLPMFLPKQIEEQQKIADFLNSIDNLITAHTQKLDALKAHKKGLMQQLFPAEGETVPKLRFSEFGGEWNRTSLNELFELLSGHAFKSEHFSKNGKKLLIPKNFTKSGAANFTEKNTKYTTEKYDERYLCSDGDLLILLTDLTPSCELLGKPLLLESSDGEVLLNQRIAKVIPLKQFDKRFMKYVMLTRSFRNWIINTATGTTVRHSSNNIVLSAELAIPSKKEQTKIADCLSSLDNRVEGVNRKVESLKAHKRGLMQKLFPTMKEVN